MFPTYPESFSLPHPLHESLNLTTKYKLPLVSSAIFIVSDNDRDLILGTQSRILQPRDHHEF
jgi:hypothetical protein